MAALGSDYLSNLHIPDYHPSYQVPSELQGNKTSGSSFQTRAIVPVYQTKQLAVTAGALAFSPAELGRPLGRAGT